MIPLSEPGATIRNLVIRETKNTLRDLSPGATYELQLYTVFENKESQVILPLQMFLHQYYKYFYCRPTSRPTSRRSPTPRGGSSSGSVTRRRCSCCGSRPSRPATTPTTRCVDIHVDIKGWISTLSTISTLYPGLDLAGGRGAERDLRAEGCGPPRHPRPGQPSHHVKQQLLVISMSAYFAC